MTLRLSVPLAAAFAILTPLAAAANTATCANRTAVVEALLERFGEQQAGEVRSRSDELFEIFSNDTNQTWTILLTLPDRGLTCHVASGRGTDPLAVQLAALQN
jgi:hypothetical protein